MTSFISSERLAFHASLLKSVLRYDKGAATNADRGSRPSTEIAANLLALIRTENVDGLRLAGQTSGRIFESICADFIERTFPKFSHLRPGHWQIKLVRNRGRLQIAEYEQYAHLISLAEAMKQNPSLAAFLGNDYTISPDIVVCRRPEPDEFINSLENLVDSQFATKTSIREANNMLPLLHASISCKWTIRSDRAQNSRSEALNLIRNRKGRLPHIAVITGEPLPARLASIALGTGDIDCVYHFALPELVQAVAATNFEDASELLTTMIAGKRLKDISDLPLDICI